MIKAIIAQMKSYNNEQERKRQKNKEMKAENALEGTEGDVGDVSNKIDLVMVANTKGSQDINNNNYESCVDGNRIAKKGALIMHNIDIEDNVEEERWDYTNKYINWEGGNSATMTNLNRIECLRTISVMTELERIKWQIYFSHLTERKIVQFM
jgi:hypothetical protein